MSRAQALRIAAAVVVAVAALVGGLPAQAAAPKVAGSLQLADNAVAPGSSVTLSGALPPRRSRTVKLQAKIAGTWVVLTSKKSTSTGAFTFSTMAPTAAGGRAYRVLAPAATLGGRRYPAVVTPTRTLTVVTMTSVDAGWHHACAVGSDHRAWCWGSNTYGELGDGQGGTFTTEMISGPVQVQGGNWKALSAFGGSTCGLKRDSTAWCWGDHGAYTTSTEGKVPAPVQVPGQWRQIASGWFHACGVMTDGTGWCWGQNNGQLGTDQPVEGSKVKLPGSWVAIVPGGLGGTSDITCGIKTDRSAMCWGANGSGQLGNDSITPSGTPVEVAGDHDWAQLSVGGEHVCGVTTDGAGWCWGSNLAGRLGDGTVAERQVPTRVTLADAWTTIDAGFQHTCGVTAQTTAWCWGVNDHGELGDGTTTTQYYFPLNPHELSGAWRDVAAGHESSVGARAPGTAWAWGAADFGQTGQGESDPALTPVAVTIDP